LAFSSRAVRSTLLAEHLRILSRLVQDRRHGRRRLV
jgi:hypothetical protein